MKLIQFFLPGKGKRVGLVQGDRVLDITSTEEGVRSTLDLVAHGKTAQGMVARATWLSRTLHRKGLDWRELLRPPSRRVAHLLIPIDPPEVWGATDTYAPVAGVEFIPAPGSFSDAPPASSGPSGRPALFFKATAARTVGPDAPIAIRHDSRLTIPEAGLAAILGAEGAVVAFTAGDDLTAQDLERCSPGFLSQARIYGGSCALGPCLVTPDEVGEPRGLQIRCSIIREGQTLFSEATNTARLRQPVTETMAWLCRDNPVPVGTVLVTGTGIPVPDSAALAVGDRVEVEIQGIGRLGNPVGWGSTASR